MKHTNARAIAFLCLFFIFILHPSYFILASDWPQLQHDPQRTGRSEYPLVPPFHIAWTLDISRDNDLGILEEVVQPIVYGGKLYFGTLSGNMACFDAATGGFVWMHKVDFPIAHTAAAFDNMVVFACLGGSVYAVDSETGEGRWRFTPDNAGPPAGFSTAPCVADGRVFMGNRAGVFFCLNGADGKLLWQARVKAPIFNSAAYDNGRVFFGDESLSVNCLDAATGETVWTSEQLYGKTFKDLHPVIVNGRVLINSMGVGHSAHWAASYLEHAYRDKIKDEHGKGTEADFVPRENFHPARDEAYRGAREYLEAHPYLQTSFILDEMTGQVALVPEQFRTASMCSPVPAPAITADGLASVPILYKRYNEGWHHSAFGLLDPMTGEIAVAFVPRGGFNADETSAFAIGGDVLIVLHGHEYGHSPQCGYNGAFDLRTGKTHEMPDWSSIGMSGTRAAQNCRYPADVVRTYLNEAGNHAPSISNHSVYAFWSRVHMTCWADSTIPKDK